MRKKPSRINPVPEGTNISVTKWHLMNLRKQGMRNWLLEELTLAFMEARKGKLKTFNEHSFEVNYPVYLNRLCDAILERHYTPGSSIGFVVWDPMVREIFAAPFLDRVVHHLLYHLNAQWNDDTFIKDSYSCRENKGTLYGVFRVQEMMREASANFTKPAYIIKLDIKGFFMSLSREKLLETVLKCLKRQYDEYQAAFPREVRQLYQLNKFLWTKIIMDDPLSHVTWRCGAKERNKVPYEKSLLHQKKGYGIVIGNLTSQLLSNIFLNRLDHFVTEELGYQYYGRYVDDFFIIVPEEEYEQAKCDVKIIEQFLREELQLQLHPKKRYYQSIYRGVTYLGVKIYPHCLYPGNRLQGKFRRAVAGLALKQTNNETMNSYLGLFKHLDGRKFVKRVFRQYGVCMELYDEWMRESGNRRKSNEIVDEMRAQAERYREKNTRSPKK